VKGASVAWIGGGLGWIGGGGGGVGGLGRGGEGGVASPPLWAGWRGGVCIGSIDGGDTIW